MVTTPVIWSSMSSEGGKKGDDSLKSETQIQEEVRLTARQGGLRESGKDSWVGDAHCPKDPPGSSRQAGMQDSGTILPKWRFPGQVIPRQPCICTITKTAEYALSRISTEDHPRAPRSFLKTQGLIIQSPTRRTPSSKEMFPQKTEPRIDGPQTSPVIPKEKGTY